MGINPGISDLEDMTMLGKLPNAGGLCLKVLTCSACILHDIGCSIKQLRMRYQDRVCDSLSHVPKPWDVIDGSRVLIEVSSIGCSPVLSMVLSLIFTGGMMVMVVMMVAMSVRVMIMRVGLLGHVQKVGGPLVGITSPYFNRVHDCEGH